METEMKRDKMKGCRLGTILLLMFLLCTINSCCTIVSTYDVEYITNVTCQFIRSFHYMLAFLAFCVKGLNIDTMFMCFLP